MITVPAVRERCAGIDVGKRGLAVAIAVGPVDKEAEIILSLPLPAALH